MKFTNRPENSTLNTALWVSLMLVAYAWMNFDTIQYEIGRNAAQPMSWDFFVCLYFIIFAAGGVALGLLLTSANTYLLILAGCFFLTAITTNEVAVDLLKLKILDKVGAEWLLSELKSAPAAISEFRWVIIKHLAISLGLALPFILIARLAKPQIRKRMTRPALLALGSLGVYFISGLMLYHFFKPAIPIESNFMFYALDLELRPSPDIPPVDLKPVRESRQDKVVLLVDESLTYEGYTDQLSKRWSKWPSVDFGDAISLGNCSAASNSILRWGFRAQRMLEGHDPRVAPTVWGYAREAGYTTILIDGQHNGAYQNYMTRKEAALIDRYVGVERGIDTDHAIAEMLHDLMGKPGRMFIYVNKRGDHFPYANNFPKEKFPDALTNEQKYAASIAYSSQDFLDVMLNNISLTDLWVIYTSDHGERFDGVGIPHCNAIPSRQETSVPLILLTGQTELLRQAEVSASILRNRVGHEQILATLLYAMGYDLKAAENLYGTSLLSETIPQHYYNVATSPVASKGGASAVTEVRRVP
jgi:hypothetical protein